MALSTDKAVEIFVAMNQGKIKDTEIEVREARSAIQDLAKNPSPNNRYEMAQLMGFTVNDILEQQTNFIETFGDVKNVGLDEKAYFDVELDGIQAFIQAKGATTQRSKVLTKKMTIDTQAVSVRPVIDFISLAQGKVNFDAIINDAAFKMQNAKLTQIQNVLYAAMKTYADPNYNTGSGLVKATLDPMIVAFSRLGQVSLVGDLAVTSKLAALTGWTGAFSTDIVNQQNQNGYIGNYNGANVTKLVNPFIQHSLTSTYLKKNLLYVLPSGMPGLRPLKVVNEGNIVPMENTNIDDRSFEVRLDQHFGAAVVIGSVPYMGMYEDSSVTA